MSELSDPLKAPFIKVYNFDNLLIASSRFSEVGIESPGVDVVSLKYTYDDEDDDECIIRLQASDTKWMDYLALEIEDFITVSWGYIGGPTTEKRTVVIRDIKSKYGPNIIWTELICTDQSTYLKLSNSPYVSKISPIEYIKQYCSGTLDVEIRDVGKLVYLQRSYEKYGEVADEVHITHFTADDPVNVPEDYLDNERRFLKDKKIYERELEVGKWYSGRDNLVREFMEKERDVNVINKSPYTIIRDIMQVCPRGPWFVTGRDNKLVIHNRNLGGGIYRNYEYDQEEGYLLDFSPETKYEAFHKNNINQKHNDPLTKNSLFIESYIDTLYNLRNVKEILTDRSISDKQRTKELAEWLSVYNNGYKKYQTLKRAVGINTQGEPFPEDQSGDPTLAGKLANKNKTGLNMPFSSPTFKTPLGETYSPAAGIYGYEYLTPLTDISETANIAGNEARKLASEKHEAKVIIEGDPILKNDLTIFISNVQSVHQGPYYIKDCEHAISNMGYKVTVNTFKVTDDTIVTSNIGESDEKERNEPETVTEETGETEVIFPPEFANMTMAEADELLREDLIIYQNIVNRNVKAIVNQNQFDALVSHTYNTGGSNQLFTAINNEEPESVIKELWLDHYITSQGKVVQGLINRRRAEWELYTTPAELPDRKYNMVMDNIEILKQFEGIHDGDPNKPLLQPKYSDIDGVWTVGWGHVIEVETRKITKEKENLKRKTGIDKYKKEERIFRAWEIDVYISTGKEFKLPAFGYGGGSYEDQKEYIKLDSYLKQYPDTKASDLVDLYKNNQLKLVESNTEFR